METAHTYLLSIYCKVKQWIQRNKLYYQIKMCMCMDGGVDMVVVAICGVYGGRWIE